MTTPPTAIHTHPSSVQHATNLAKNYRQRNATKAFLAILSNYITITTCILLSETSARAPSLPSPIRHTIYLLSLLIIASRLRAFENLVHEASHNNLFPTPQQHQTFQFLYSFPVFRIVSDYRQSHLIHHLHLGDRNKDPDILRLFDLGLDSLSERPVWYLFGMPMTGYLSWEYLSTTFVEFWTSESSRVSKTAFWGGIIFGISYWNLHSFFLSYYILPFFIILPITRYWAEISEHLGLDLSGEFGSSRTNIGWLHRWYLNPHNDGFHAVHHLCSQVPFYLLEIVHGRLMEGSEEFRGKTVVSRGVGETFGQMRGGRTIVKGGVA
ncbi:MAG: hypothetical protein Q9221_004922 [Calogaya cf. arnoldii]